GTYPASNNDDLTALMKSISEMDAAPDDLGFRLGNVINVYNIFQHFYPYFEVVETNWDEDFKMALNRSFQDSTMKDHLITLQKFTAKLKDGHVRVNAPDNQKYAPPIAWEWINNELVVTELFDNIALNVGDVVTHINGLPSSTYFAEVES